MLYQLSYVRVVKRNDSNIRWHPHPGATDHAPPTPSGVPGSPRTGPQVHRKHQDTVIEGHRGVTNDGEVLEISLGLLDKAGPFLASHRGKRP